MAAIFFSQRKPRGFNYKPRFYDPDAEEREARKRVVLGEKYVSKEADENYVPGSMIRRHVATRRGGVADTMHKRRKKTASIPILIAVLALLGYLIWMWYFK